MQRSVVLPLSVIKPNTQRPVGRLYSLRIVETQPARIGAIHEGRHYPCVLK
jgi:hypothetical protein